MSDRTGSRRPEALRSGPGLLLVADDPNVSKFIRLPGAADMPTAQLAQAIETAVGAGVVVEFYAADGDLKPAFRLSRRHRVIQVDDGGWRHLGTFASGAAAVVFGWERSRAMP